MRNPVKAWRFCLMLLVVAVGQATAEDVTLKVDWKDFLTRHDLIWNKLPSKWGEGAFVGNGLMGAMIYAGDEPDTVRFHIGRSDVVFRSERIPVGDLILKPVGKIQKFAMRLDLWNAEADGKITTDAGAIEFRALTHADQMVQLVQIKPTGGESACAFDWKPGLAAPPRKVFRKEALASSDKNPAPMQGKDGDLKSSVQPVDEGEHATVWTEVVDAAGDGTRTLVLSVGWSPKEKGKAELEATKAVKKAAATSFDDLVASHQKYWHGFYPESFVSIPDTRLESFYWIQMYKFASATRADRPAIDLCGPWFRSTPWPKIWWNLNIQLTYWPVLTANRLELGESLCKMLDAGAKNLAANAKEFASDSASVARTTSYDCAGKAGQELCNLPWTMHNYWLQYRYSMDEGMLKDRIYPLLKQSINYYLHFVKMGADNQLHITAGYSPEYPNQPSPNPDCNIDLALLKWGCGTLLDTAERFHIDDPQIPQWKKTLVDLVPYPTDENGLRISKSVAFSESHRHYSHLLMVYPLYLMNADQPESVPLIKRTMDHWLGMPAALRGYSYTGAASMYAMFGQGEESAKYLNQLLDNKMHSGKLQVNTMYTEAGPVIETPFSAAASLNDMLLSSWGDKIRVFPGVPKSWADVSFYNLRAQGAFLVSAVRKGGKTQFVRIQSLAGQPCRVKTDLAHPAAEGGVAVDELGDGVVELPLQKGQTVVLHEKSETPTMDVDAVAPQPGHLNTYGVHGGA